VHVEREIEPVARTRLDRCQAAVRLLLPASRDEVRDLEARAGIARRPDSLLDRLGRAGIALARVGGVEPAVQRRNP